MAEAPSTLNQTSTSKWDVNSLMEKVLELQDSLAQAQERNLLLSAQMRELERLVRDAEDLKAELSTQGLLLTDKTRENKCLHQELSRITTVLDMKLQEVEEFKVVASDLQRQLKTREAERDQLTIMLNEIEQEQRQAFEDQEETQVLKEMPGPGWLRHFKGKSV